MTRNSGPDLGRRLLLAASAGLIVPRFAWAESRELPALCWKLVEHGDTAREIIQGTDDPIASRTGHAIWVGEGRERALRLDGYSVWVSHTSALPLSSSALTISAWLALESYPVDEAALVELSSEPDTLVRFTIDKWGYLNFRVKSATSESTSKSTVPLSRGAWVHVAVACSPSRITLYIDGSPAGDSSTLSQDLQLTAPVQVTLGKSSAFPPIAGVFPTGVLNGLIKDVCIFDSQLTRASIEAVLQKTNPDKSPDLQINGQWCSDDSQRPAYHAQPPRAWTNEPHGLIYWGGQYHLFYQKNANGPYWGHINWGHMTSPDLYRWTEMPVALSPEHGPDAEGCWSGSVIDHDGKLTIVYTAGDGKRASICLASSTDGVHFTKYPGNPIIPQPPQGLGYPEFRDPFVWREGDWYYLIIGSAIKDIGGTALLYRSKDMIAWEYRKPLLVGDRENSGIFWEMPIFVKVGDRHALIVCEVPGRASYWVGEWKDETFTPINPSPRRLELFNHLLSPTPLSRDGQTIAMGIIPDERHPKETWKAGWAHLYSLPRVLSTDTTGHLYQKPQEGIERWSKQMLSVSNYAIREGAPNSIDKVSGTRLHIRATFNKGESRSVSLLVRRSPDGREQTVIRYEWEIGKLTLDRSLSSLNPLVKRDTQDATYFPLKDGSISFSVFLDESVMEVFIDDRAAFATRIYPTLGGSDGVALACFGKGAQAERLTIASISKPSGELA